jgi:aminopeptidase N
LRAIDRLERGTPGREAFRAYARGIIRPVLDRLGWDIAPDEGAESRLLRALTIMTLGRLGDPAVIAEARRRFAAFLRSPQTLDPDLRDPVVATVGRWADRRTFEDLHRLGREAASTEEKMRFYGALATASDPALIDDAVRIALTDQALPNGQVEQFFYKATGANDDPDYLWRRVFAERRGLLARMSESDRQYLLPDVAGATSSPAIALEMRWAPESRASRGARSEADKAGERIEFQADFKERLLPAVDAWIKANGG